ncbi:unnamed protein product [Closterium sp. Yama58-4]|nr:unnamed protein product [Closterium sp. Yama58-4]
MVGAVGDTGVVDTLEARLESARRRHEAKEFGDLPWAVVEAGIRSVWATEHPPSRPASPRPVNTEGGVDVGVNAGGDQGDVGGRRNGLAPMSATHVTVGGIAPSYGYFKFMSDRISVTPLLVGQFDILTWKEAIEPQLEMAGLMGFAAGTVATPSEDYLDVRAEFRILQLLTFTVISRCCSPGVQIALKSCRDYINAGHRAWHFIESTYQVTDDLFIGQLEEQLSYLWMGDQETATDYCNRARRIVATMRMAIVQYSTASYNRKTMSPRRSTVGDRGSMGSLAAVVAAGRSRRRTPTSRSRPRMAVAEEEVGVGSAGTAAAPTTFPSSPDRSDSDDDDAKGGCGRLASRRPRRGNQPRKEKQSNKLTSTKDVDSSAGGKEASCSLVGVVEPTVSLAPEAGEDFQAVAAAVQANPAVGLLDSGCSHHLIGMKETFDVQGRGTVAQQGDAGKRVLIPDVLYIRGVAANLPSAGQLKENGVKMHEDDDGMLLVSATSDVLGRATYSGQVLCTNVRPCSATNAADVVTLRAIVSATKSTPDRLHSRLVHVSMDTIRSSAKHEVATGLDLKSASGADSRFVSCVGGKLARHTFPDQGSDADDVLAVVHVDLYGPFRVAVKDGSLYFLLLKDRKTRYVWVRPVAKKSGVLREFQQWLVLVERQANMSVLQLHSDRGGEFLGKDFTAFMDGKGILHDLT